jgi:RHS repeat-associated protein
MLTQLRSLLCEYHYDPLDRLTSHAQPNAPVHRRFYCKSRLATEIQGALRKTIFQSGDQILGQQQRQNDSIEVVLLATDQQRSVLQTLQKDNLPQPIAYSPYGHHRAESGLSSLLGFNGERADPVTGHYLLGNGYRAFNPVLMRFNSPDSWSPFGRGGLNAYAYCDDNPIGRTDPTGHNPLLAIKTFLTQKVVYQQRPYTQIGYFMGSREAVKTLGTKSSLVKGYLVVNKTTKVNAGQSVSFLTEHQSAEPFGVLLPDDKLHLVKSPLKIQRQGGANQFIVKTDEYHGVPSGLQEHLVFTEAPAPEVALASARAPTIISGGSAPNGSGASRALDMNMRYPQVMRPPTPQAQTRRLLLNDEMREVRRQQYLER